MRNSKTGDNSHTKNIRGLTLVELLLAMAIVSFILAAAYGVSTTLLNAREKYDAVSRASNILNALQQLIVDDMHNIYMQAGDETVIWKKNGVKTELHIITSNSLVSNNGELVEVVYSWQAEVGGVRLWRLEKEWPEQNKSAANNSFELGILKTFDFEPLNSSQQKAWTGNMLDPNWEDKNAGNALAENVLENDYIPGFNFTLAITPQSIINDEEDNANTEDSDRDSVLQRNFTIYFAGNRGIRL